MKLGPVDIAAFVFALPLIVASTLVTGCEPPRSPYCDGDDDTDCLRRAADITDDEDDDDEDPREGEGEGGVEGEGEGGGNSDEIVAALEAVGFYVFAIDDNPPDDFGDMTGVVAIEAQIEQLVDEKDPTRGTFFQRVAFLHRNTTAPMVVNTTGYSYYGNYPEEITLMMQANQVIIEHRYFSTSTPQSSDWTPLTIENAAYDHHVIVDKLRGIYDGNFVATGHSKGGMTSLFHKRFYPDDLDGVLAYVAPISFALGDTRYDEFRATAGDDFCRDSIRALQTDAVALFDEVVDVLVADYPAWTREQLASFAAAQIGSFDWGYWQFQSYYGGCDFGDITDPQSVIALFGLDPTYIDGSFVEFQAYEYQVGHQLGEPDQVSEHVRAALAPFNPDPFAVLTVSPTFAEAPIYDDGAAMLDIADFFADRDDVAFLYGGVDPWSGGAYDAANLPSGHYYMVPGADHGASLSMLFGQDRADAFDFVSRVGGVDVAANGFFSLSRGVPGRPRTLGDAYFEQEFGLRFHR